MFGRKKLKKYREGDEKKLQEDIEKMGGLEKGDFTAMVIAALTTIVPICLLVLLGIVGIAYLVFYVLL